MCRISTSLWVKLKCGTCEQNLGGKGKIAKPHLKEYGDCIGFLLGFYGSSLIGSQCCWSRHWSWAYIVLGLFSASTLTFPRNKCMFFSRRKVCNSFEMITVPHHPAALRTTDSREDQLLHPGSWNPKIIYQYGFQIWSTIVYSHRDISGVLCLIFIDDVLHLALKSLLDSWDGGGKSRFILLSQPHNLIKCRISLCFV